MPHLFLEQVIRLGGAMARRGHGGRPSKGDRDHIVTRPSRVVGDLVRQRAPATILRRPEEVGLVIHPAVGGPPPDIEYLACADDLATCARLAAQLQERLERSAAEAEDYCRRLLRRHLRVVR